MALQLGLIQESLTPQLQVPTIVLFAGDHGIVAEGVSPYPQDVTYQMVYNFLAGGAAINVFAEQHGIQMVIVDAGVNHDFPADADLIQAKIAYGTANALHEPAMSDTQRDQALAAGANVVQDILDGGCNIIGFGEMGIGNTSSSAMLMNLICDIPIAECVGRGTGLDDAGVNHKATVLAQAIDFHKERWTTGNIEPGALDFLSAVGGFEITQMVGGMIQAASQKAAILVDGFISTAAFLVAAQIQPAIKEYAIFTHQSNEKGHRMMLESLEANIRCLFRRRPF